MLINIGFDISYEVWADTPMILLLHVHPSREGDLQQPENFSIFPNVPREFFLDSFGNRAVRFAAPPGPVRLTLDAVVREGGLPDACQPNALQSTVNAPPPEVLPYLMASRY